MEEQGAKRGTWGQSMWKLEFSNALVIATFGEDGGAIVDKLPRLFCNEGRLQSFRLADGSPLRQLGYAFWFTGRRGGDPLAYSVTAARVVITGTASNGLRVEIRGNGWIGYDVDGHLEGRFDFPPVIITEDDGPEDDDGHLVAQKDPAKSIHGHPMPPHFTRATVRVPPLQDH